VGSGLRKISLKNVKRRKRLRNGKRDTTLLGERTTGLSRRKREELRKKIMEKTRWEEVLELFSEITIWGKKMIKRSSLSDRKENKKWL